jgi:hypothetical protein
MEAPATPGNASSSSDNICNSPTYRIQAAASNIIQGPLTGLLEYSGILGGGGGAGSSNSPDTEYLQVVSNESFPVEVEGGGGGGGGGRGGRGRGRGGLHQDYWCRARAFLCSSTHSRKSSTCIAIGSH